MLLMVTTSKSVTLVTILDRKTIPSEFGWVRSIVHLDKYAQLAKVTAIAITLKILSHLIDHHISKYSS